MMLYENILKNERRPIEELAEEFYIKVIKAEHPKILESVNMIELRRSIYRNFRLAAETIGYLAVEQKSDESTPGKGFS